MILAFNAEIAALFFAPVVQISIPFVSRHNLFYVVFRSIRGYLIESLSVRAVVLILQPAVNASPSGMIRRKSSPFIAILLVKKLQQKAAVL